MAVKQYIGARYVPKFLGNYDPTQEYEALDVVDNGAGTSYIATKIVPPGTPLTNSDYWFLYGSSSGAIIHLQDQIDDIMKAVVTPEMFGAAGNGITDDTVALQAALDSGSIVICKKTYKITGSVTMPKGVSISGNGTIVVDNNGNFFDAVICSGDNNITGITFTDTATTYDTLKYMIGGNEVKNVTVEGCIFNNIHSGYCICFTKSEFLSIRYNNIDHYSYSGIMFMNGCINCDVSYNRVYDGRDTSTSNRYPISISGYLLVADRPAQNIKVYNNYIEDLSPYWEGIDSHSCENCEIVGNRIINTAYGIMLTSPTTPTLATGNSVSNVLVKNNYISTNGSGGVANGIIASVGVNGRGGVQNVRIENNRILILNNTSVHTSIAAGIGIRSSSRLLSILNNYINNSARGISLSEGAVSVLIEGNDIEGGLTAADSGIDLSEVTISSNLQIIANFIHSVVRSFTGTPNAITNLIIYKDNYDNGVYNYTTYTTAPAPSLLTATKALGFPGCFIPCSDSTGNVIGWFCLGPNTWKAVSGSNA